MRADTMWDLRLKALIALHESGRRRVLMRAALPLPRLGSLPSGNGHMNSLPVLVWSIRRIALGSAKSVLLDSRPESLQRLPPRVDGLQRTLAGPLVQVLPAPRTDSPAVLPADRKALGLEEQPIPHLGVELDPLGAALQPHDVVVTGVSARLRVATGLLIDEPQRHVDGNPGRGKAPSAWRHRGARQPAGDHVCPAGRVADLHVEGQRLVDLRLETLQDRAFRVDLEALRKAALFQPGQIHEHNN